MSVLAPVIDNIPTELKQRPAWVTWKLLDGRKVPFDPKNPWRRASSTNPETWGTFEQAEASYSGGAFSGLGVVLNDDGLVGVDIDGCVADGAPSSEAMALADELGAAYVEVSPSGRGLRMFGYGEPLKAGVNGTRNGLKAELYSTARYLTVTGHALRTGPLRHLNNFQRVAESFRAPTPGTTNQPVGSAEDRIASWIEQVMSGAVYHDALRNVAASFIAQGLSPAVTKATLFALMDNVSVTKDERWAARRAQIPALVDSAYGKFAVRDFSAVAANDLRYSIVRAEQLWSMPNVSWVVKGILPQTGLAAVYGPPGSGKTFLCLSIAAAIAEGERWFGRRVRPAEVVYVALEGEGGIKQRAAAWSQCNGRDLPDRLGFIFDDFAVAAGQDVADLAKQIPEGGVVFIDTLNRAAPEADENSSADMGKILRGAKELQRRINGLVVLVHHSGKDVTKGLRGHSSLLAALDAVLEVQRDANGRQWRIAKSKDGGDEAAAYFDLKTETLGLDEDGDPVTSCAVVECAGPPLPAAKPLTRNQQRGVDALRSVQASWDGYVERESWREAFYALCPDMKVDARRKAFARAVEELVDLWMVVPSGTRYSLVTEADERDMAGHLATSLGN